jgi:hypothetical protein
VNEAEDREKEREGKESDAFSGGEVSGGESKEKAEVANAKEEERQHESHEASRWKIRSVLVPKLRDSRWESQEQEEQAQEN